jgi:hypothetical protein
MRTTPLTLCALVSVLAACGDDFDPKSLLNKYRVVGITSDVNETTVDGRVTLKAWDFVPASVGQVIEGAQPPTYTWSFCPFPLGAIAQFRCFEYEGKSLELPVDGDTAEVVVDFGPNGLDLTGTVLADLQKILGELGAPAEGEEIEVPTRIPVQFRLVAGHPSIGEFETVKSFVIRLPTAPPEPLPNNNPRVAGFTADGVPFCTASVGPGAPECLAAAPTETKLRLEVLVDDPARDLCTEDDVDQARCVSGDPATESLVYSWFTTAGELEFDLTNDETPTNTLVLPRRLEVETASSQRVRVFVAVRDGRGGLDVVEASFDMTSLP